MNTNMKKKVHVHVDSHHKDWPNMIAKKTFFAQLSLDMGSALFQFGAKTGFGRKLCHFLGNHLSVTREARLVK